MDWGVGVLGLMRERIWDVEGRLVLKTMRSRFGLKRRRTKIGVLF